MNAPGMSLADRFWIAHRWAAFALGTVFLVGVIVAGIAGRIRPHYAWAYALMSNLAFLAYGLDKSAAVADRWRWSEKSLHWIALLCGWPGALIGQHAFRHKSRKASLCAQHGCTPTGVSPVVS
jgi:uncharacterized membrane protein YsdA (DUF1294 family)